MKQNIYDNETFFDGYKKIRENKTNANILFEKPALFSLLPDLTGKRILDLGCGYGENCMEFVNKGASDVVGIDISKKMLEVAEKENSNPKITFKNMPMEDIAQLTGKFDIVVSSLALHYIKDFSGLVKNIYSLLNDRGLFIFSQEHPFNTCFTQGERWTKDSEGNKLFANISNYSIDGERKSKWFVEGVEKYHRTFSSIINTLVENGFQIVKLIEPAPSLEMAEEYPEHSDLRHKPDFLLVKVAKPIPTV